MRTASTDEEVGIKFQAKFTCNLLSIVIFGKNNKNNNNTNFTNVSDIIIW